MSRKKERRFFFSVIEEGIMNPDYKGYRGGRVEWFDKKDKSAKSYASGEARFFIPEEFMGGFRELFDFKESDLPIMIDWRMKEEK